jgi:hypothetical protein
VYKHRSHSLILNFAKYSRKIKKKFSKRNISVLYLRSVPIFAAEKRNFDAVAHISSVEALPQSAFNILNFQPRHHIPIIYLAYSFPIPWMFLRRTLDVPTTYLESIFLLSTFFLPSSYLLPTFFLPTTLYLPKEYFIS